MTEPIRRRQARLPFAFAALPALVALAACAGQTAESWRNDPHFPHDRDKLVYDNKQEKYILAGGLTAADVLALAEKYPAEALYSMPFYLVATPEQVKRAIGGRDLSQERKILRVTTRREAFGAPPQIPVFNPFHIDKTFKTVDITSPLYEAAWSTPYPEVIDILVAAGQSVNQIVGDKQLPPQKGLRGFPKFETLKKAALRNPDPRIMAAVLRHNPHPVAKKDVLFSLVTMDKYAEKLVLLARSGAELNTTSLNPCETPLTLAVHRRQYTIIATLLRLGADPNYLPDLNPGQPCPFFADTPLGAALREKDERAAAMLRRAGAKEKAKWQE